MVVSAHLFIYCWFGHFASMLVEEAVPPQNSNIKIKNQYTSKKYSTHIGFGFSFIERKLKVNFCIQKKEVQF